MGKGYRIQDRPSFSLLRIDCYRLCIIRIIRIDLPPQVIKKFVIVRSAPWLVQTGTHMYNVS